MQSTVERSHECAVTNAIHGARKAWCECFNYDDTKLKKEKRS
jgi:hypothetical protein